MRLVKSVIFISIFSMTIFAQAELQKLVDTEQAFAKFTAENGMKAGFLEYLADDGLLFMPNRVNGKDFWNAGESSPALLSWAPNYADISANGILGYTTGNWNYRPKGKDDAATAFGQYISIWLRMPDGKYKLVLDMGISHKDPHKYSTNWTTTADKSKDPNLKNSSAGDNTNGFFVALEEKGIAKAYETYAADDIRAFREGLEPVVGKKNLISLLKNEKAGYSVPKRSMFFGSADLAYNSNTYTKTVNGKVVEKGNTLQIWKLINGRWRIVLDIFKLVP